MGGLGSGRPRTKPYLGMFPRVGVKSVARLEDGNWLMVYLSNGRAGCAYRTPTGADLVHEGNPVRQSVQIDRLPCHFGGTRPVFRCPNCWRRCCWLYLDGGWFECRRCVGAPYWSQTASPSDRMGMGIRRLQARLAPGQDINRQSMHWIPRRPRGMRRATYRRLAHRLEWLIEQRDGLLLLGIMHWLERMQAIVPG